jgi:hypothetical protein
MADINASEFYNLGYGKQSPQIGYGRAQINQQQPMPSAPDLAQSFASGKQIRLAEEAQKQKKRKAQIDLDKTVGDALSGGVYINPALNEMQKRDIEAAKERFNNIDKSKNSDLEIQTIIKDLEAKKEYYKNQDKRYVGAYDAATKMEGYYSNPLVTGIVGMDFSDATDEELANAFSGSIQVEQRLDPTKRRDEIGSAVVETLFKNPDYYTVNGTINDMGDLNEYMKKSTLTPEGVEYLKATLLSDQVLQDAIQQQNRFGNKPIDANEFIEDYIDANFSRSNSQFRSDEDKKNNGDGVQELINKISPSTRKVSGSDGEKESVERFVAIPQKLWSKVEVKVGNDTVEGVVKEVRQHPETKELEAKVSYDVKGATTGGPSKIKKDEYIPYSEVREVIRGNSPKYFDSLDEKISSLSGSEVTLDVTGLENAIMEGDDMITPDDLTELGPLLDKWNIKYEEVSGLGNDIKIDGVGYDLSDKESAAKLKEVIKGKMYKGKKDNSGTPEVGGINDLPE